MRPYEQLREDEKYFVDRSIINILQDANRFGITPTGKPYQTPLVRLMGDDKCERFVDAFATWIIESRKA